VLPTGVAVIGVVVLVLAAVSAARRRPRESFAWLVIVGAAYSLLGLAVELRAPGSGGLAAAVLQAMTTLLAGALGACVLWGAAEKPRETTRLGTFAMAVAWMSLVGLPPMAGIHGRILICRSLLDTGWEWLAILAVVAGSVAALSVFSILDGRAVPRPGKLSALGIAALASVTFLAGVYPQPGVAAAMWLAGLVLGA
jgi:NADH:ubiquinone oxidoreductase subunit 2 (subunit N)